MVAVVEVLLAGYVAWLLLLWVKIHRQDVDLPPEGALPSATILVVFRNEEAALPELLSLLTAADAAALPILAVDDHSTDQSAAVVERLQQGIPDRIGYRLSAGMPGKRTAVADVMPLIQTDAVLQTDADCAPSASWSGQALRVLAQGHGDLAILPVRFRSERLSSFWLSVVNTEFAAVMAVTCGMARMGRPVMCNGANLAYRKSLWSEAAPALAAQPHAGGDDMFLLDYAVTHGKRMVYNDAPAVWVETEAPDTWAGFFAQRRRWAAKWTAYRSLWPYAVGGISLLGQGAFAAAPWLLWEGGVLLGFGIGAKVLAEAVLLRRQLEKGGMRFSVRAFLFWQVFYLPYVLVSALPSLWWRPSAQWKN